MKTRSIIALALASVACKAKTDAGASREVAVAEQEAPSNGTALALDEGKLGKHVDQLKGEKVAEPDVTADKPAAAPARDFKTKNEPKKPEDANKDVGEGKPETAATRTWFPETFLWNPLVVTDDQGHADVAVRVPDRLTSWHVLALAHSRAGAQAGAETRFLGTLPSYVDVVVPPFLTVGDEIALPVQVVNTTSAPIAATLTASADGATLAPLGGARTIPAGGSLVERAQLSAPRPGVVKLRAAIGNTDAVERTLEVRPAGKPVTTQRSGTLAAPRTLALVGPADADPATDRVRLVVYPGALALVRSELGVSVARTSPADDAYALALAGRAPALLAALGDRADPDVVRDLALVAGQKVIRDGRTLDLDAALVLGEGALAHPQNPVLARLGERVTDWLANQQRPDGSFGGGEGWTVQRVLVATAEGARAVALAQDTPAAKQRAARITARASAMVERNLERVTDPYTASAILAAGLGGPATAKLVAIVIAAMQKTPDGARFLEAPADAVRVDGTTPAREEVTALAILALGTAATTAGDRAAIPDLGATLLGAYSPIRGWGDGRTNLLAIRAVTQLFKEPVPAGVSVTLAIDGAPIAQRTLDAAALRDAVSLDVAVPGGVARSHVFELRAQPAVPGLAYALVVQSYVPWPKERVHEGLELALPERVTGAVGKPIDVAITAIAPSGAPLHLVHALPAGVQADTASLDKLVAAGTLTRYATSDGQVELFVPPLAPAATFAASYRVIATLAGTLHAGASRIEQGPTSFHVPPTTWLIH